MLIMVAIIALIVAFSLKVLTFGYRSWNYRVTVAASDCFI